MNAFLNKFYNIVDKIGKQNFILVVFILFIFVVMGLFQTFSLYTSSEGLSLIDGLKTYKFILTGNDENSVAIAAESSKNLIITVSNPETIDLKYGVYYSSTSDLTNVDIGYLTSTEYLPNGDIKANSNYTVTIQVDNNSTSDVTLKFGVKYGLTTGGDLEKGTTQYWLEEKEVYLNTVEPGRYIYYVGNNGCSGYSCIGRNANYVSDSDMGYCYDSSGKFEVSGWRLAYVDNGIPYLVSAGAPECMSTNYDGTSSSSQSEGAEDTIGVPLHLQNLDLAALNYCNVDYAYQSTCSIDTSRSINESDFTYLTDGSNFSTSICSSNVPSTSCGYQNSLIDNGGFYWFATGMTDGIQAYHWYSDGYISSFYSYVAMGVRPVIKLNESLMVIGGNGTYEDPYRIATDTIKVTDLSGWGNHGISRDAVLDRTSGTVTTNGDTFVDVGLANYDFGDTVTLVTRIKFNSIDTTMSNYVLGNWETGGLGIGLAQTTSQLYFQVYVNGAYHTFTSTYAPEVDTWYNIVVTYDGTSLAIYLNGEALTLDTSVSGATSTVSGDITSSVLPIYIGGNPAGIGMMGEKGTAAIWDDVLVFDRALTAEEIASDYKTRINPTNLEDLLVYYDFK